MSTAVYLRVSSDRQAERNSTASQQHAIRRWMEARGLDYDRAEVYTDEAISGGTMDRPAMTRLMADVEAGRVDRIVALDISRVARSIEGFAVFVRRCIDAGVAIHFVACDIDISSDYGRLVASILASVAEFERRILQGRIREGVAAAIERGQPWGGAAVVSPRDRYRRGTAKLSAEQWARVVELRAMGCSYASLAAEYGVSPRTIQNRCRRARKGTA